MSVFLVYFIRNRPDANWMDFHRKNESIFETFEKANDSDSLLKIESVRILLEGKKLDAYLIHDGVSSDRILQPDLKNDFVVSRQKFTVFNFLESRLKLDTSVNHYIIFHLYQRTIYEEEVINYDREVDARLSVLKKFPETSIQRNILFRLLS